MAIGDDAIAAGMDVVLGTAPANTVDTEINKTRDEIARRTSAVTPVAKGGTGATTPAQARSNLGVTPQNIAAVVNDGAGVLKLGFVGGNHARIRVEGSGSGDMDKTVANLDDVEYVRDQLTGSVNYVNDRVSTVDSRATFLDQNKVNRGGDTILGQLYLPNAVAASSGWAVAYINGDGRVSRNASSEKYKKWISDIDPDELGDIWPQLVRYQMRGGDGAWVVGYIAERLDENDDQKRFVSRWGEDNAVEGIDHLQLLMAQVAQLNARLSALESPSNE